MNILTDNFVDSAMKFAAPDREQTVSEQRRRDIKDSTALLQLWIGADAEGADKIAEGADKVAGADKDAEGVDKDAEGAVQVAEVSVPCVVVGDGSLVRQYAHEVSVPSDVVGDGSLVRQYAHEVSVPCVVIGDGSLDRLAEGW